MQLVPGLLNGTLSVSPPQKGQDRIVSYCCSECGDEYEVAVKDIREVANSQLAAAMVSAFVCDDCSEWQTCLVYFLCMYTWTLRSGFVR